MGPYPKRYFAGNQTAIHPLWHFIVCGVHHFCSVFIDRQPGRQYLERTFLDHPIVCLY